MENIKTPNRGNGLINPNKLDDSEKKQSKKISIKRDGLMEREESKVMTDDGRELLKEN